MLLMNQQIKMTLCQPHVTCITVGVVILSLFTPSVSHQSSIPGHMRPFGSHIKPMGVTMIGKFSSPHVFYGHFVKASKPIHMKSSLIDTKHPGMEWTDEFLRKKYGRELVRVEVGKKEARGRKAQWMRFNTFVNDYSHSDLYLVHSLHWDLQDLVYVPPSLQCGGYQKALQEAVLWMGRGPLYSVLHYDDLDNLLCVFDGIKNVILIDRNYKDKVEQAGFVEEGHYSKVDLDSVNMHSFPGFQDLPWYRVHMTAGDCLYIPNRWYHQVTTYGNRSLAINLWFSRLWWFDDDDCSKNPYSASQLKSLADFGLASPNEATRSHWLEAFEGADDDVNVADFSHRVSSGTEEHRSKLYKLIDKDEDGLLSWEELYGFDIDKALLRYGDVFHRTAASSHESSASSADDQETEDEFQEEGLEGGADSVEGAQLEDNLHSQHGQQDRDEL